MTHTLTKRNEDVNQREMESRRLFIWTHTYPREMAM